MNWPWKKKPKTAVKPPVVVKKFYSYEEQRKRLSAEGFDLLCIAPRKSVHMWIATGDDGKEYMVMAQKREGCGESPGSQAVN
jgi:hypothetical protein